MNDPIIISCAVTGNKWMREDNPNIPYSASEIISASLEAVEAGAAVLHVHARTPEGKLAQRPEDFREIIEAVRREKPDTLFEMSVGNMEGKAKERLEPLLQLKPDMASFNLKGTEEETEYMFEIFNKYDVKPVFELFNEAMLERVKKYASRGLVQEPFYFNFVFDLEDVGKTTLEYSDYLVKMIKLLPPGTQWSATRGGYRALEMSAVAACLNGGIRTGLEDSIYLEEGVLAESNKQLVERAVDLVKAMGKRIADSTETKAMLGL